MTKQFPKDFVFGGATAAYQVEGETQTHGKGKVPWDDFLEAQGRFSPDPASDFYNRYTVDLELCKQFGINGIRVSIAWSRIFPTGTGRKNIEGIQYYHELFAECERCGVTPYVTLDHFDTPDAFYKNGKEGFLSRETIDAYEAYARFCFKEFPEIEHWFTFNEISATAEGMYVVGNWPYGEQYRLDKAFQVMHNMMVAHARALLAFHEMDCKGEIGIVHNCEPKYPLDPNSLADCEAAKMADVINDKWVLDATFRGHYAEDTLAMATELAAIAGGTLDIRDEDIATLTAAVPYCDCMGLNIYKCQFLRAAEGENEIRHNGTGDKGSGRWFLKGVGESAVREGIPTTDWDWIIYPKGMYDLLNRIAYDYPNYKKIYITENGMGYKDDFEDGFIDDAPRIDYIRQHLDWLLRAVDGGVNVGGYFLWSLQDQFSWTNGYNKRYGFFYVDFETQKRYPKASAYWFKNIAETGRLE